jgi:hypothetical protein
MNTDFEQAGALVSAGLAAAEIDRGGFAAHGGPAAGAACANCGQPVSGHYCQFCGQAVHLHRSLLHLIEELLHSVLHFDAKGWRTLPLLLARPGVLTRRYIDGQRTRYVSPLALFLFTGFLMFFVVSLTVGHGPELRGANPADRASAHDDLVKDLDDAKLEVTKATQALEQARRAGRDPSDAEEDLSSAQTDQRVAQAALQLVDSAINEAGSAASADAAGAGAVKHGLDKLSDLKIATGHPALDAAIRRQQDNPELFFYRLGNTAYKFLFMLIPISLPFLWLMFAGRRDVAVYDHAVFSLYSLSFMSLLIVVCALLSLTGMAASAGTLFVIVSPLHMFLQLRATYGLGVLSALWRTLALVAVAGTAFLLFLAFIILVSIR